MFVTGAAYAMGGSPGGGAGAANGLGPLDEVGEMVQIVLLGGRHVGREAGGEQGI